MHIIRSAQNPQAAIEGLMNRFELDEVQAKAIVEMRLRQLTNLMQEQLRNEYDELLKQIEYF